MAEAKKDPKKVELAEQVERFLRQATNTPADGELPGPVMSCWLKWKEYHDRVAGGGFVAPAPQVMASILLSAELLDKMDRLCAVVGSLRK